MVEIATDIGTAPAPAPHENREQPPMKILAFAASNSSQSINRQLIGYATTVLEEGLIGDVTVDTIDLHDFEMPIYSQDREAESGIPQLARDFYDKIGAADAVVISFAEHNGYYSAAYKNVFDWATRIDRAVYQDKPVVLFAASPGPGGGRNTLGIAEASAQFFGYEVKASLSIPGFQQNFDASTGSISNPDLDAQFRTALSSLGE